MIFTIGMGMFFVSVCIFKEVEHDFSSLTKGVSALAGSIGFVMMLVSIGMLAWRYMP